MIRVNNKGRHRCLDERMPSPTFVEERRGFLADRFLAVQKTLEQFRDTTGVYLMGAFGCLTRHVLVHSSCVFPQSRQLRPNELKLVYRLSVRLFIILCNADKGTQQRANTCVYVCMWRHPDPERCSERSGSSPEAAY